jgi:autotransporter-associated beta strand protein
MKPKSNAFLRASRIALCSISLTASVRAGTIWDGVKNDLSPASDTNIDNAENWNLDVLPDLTGPSTVTFGVASGAATVNAAVEFVRTTFSSPFTLDSGAGTLTLRGTNSGGNAYGIQATNTTGNVQINEPVLVKSFATSSPLGSLFLIYNNQTTADTTTLSINGGMSLASGSTATTYTIRYGTSTSSSASTSDTRIAGPISGLGTLQNSSASGSAWSGDLIIAGNQSLSTSDITISSSGSGFQSPTATARLVLGETPADIQSWRATTLNNVMNLVVKGTVSGTTFSLGTAGTLGIPGGSLTLSGAFLTGASGSSKIVGGAASNGTLKLSSGTVNGSFTTIGGAGTDEDNLNLTKQTSGTLTINGGSHTYTGATTVEAGTLNLAGCTLASPVIVNAGATLTGEGSTSSSLTFAAGASTLQFDPATSTAALTADTVDVSTPGTLVIVNPSAATTPLSTYTVLKCVNGSIDLSKFALATRGGTLSITGGGKELILTAATSTPANLIWKGNDGTNASFWDVATTLNWDNSGSDRFYTGDAVTFDDTASEFAVAVQGSSVSPGNIVFNNTSPNDYTLSGGSIGGAGSLTKNNSGTVTLANSLAHTGGITVNAGVLDLGTANNTFTGGINVAGGELKFSGAALPSTGSLNSQAITLNGGTITRASNTTITNEAQTVTINTNGSTIKMDSSATTVWRIGGKISGNGNWTKSGAGILALGSSTSPANDFTGTLDVTAGTLDVRHSDSLGSAAAGTSIQGAILLMQNFGQTTGTTITVTEPIAFSGASFLAGYSQENKTFTQQFNGLLTVADSAVLGISTARNSSGALAPTLELKDSTIVTGTGSVLSFGLRPATYQSGLNAAAQTVNVGSAISGPGAVTVQGDAGSVYTLSAPGYSGDTTVNSGTLKLAAVNANNEASTVTVESGAKIEIAFSGNDEVATLILGGTNVGPGTYNASHPTYGSYFAATGSGSIVVPAGGYSSWASVNGASANPDEDHDFDGVENGIEYFMGQSGSGFTLLPVPDSNGKVSWTKDPAYVGTFAVQTSMDLTIWTNQPHTVNGNQIGYTFPSGQGKLFVRLLVDPN